MDLLRLPLVLLTGGANELVLLRISKILDQKFSNITDLPQDTKSVNSLFPLADDAALPAWQGEAKKIVRNLNILRHRPIWTPSISQPSACPRNATPIY